VGVIYPVYIYIYIYIYIYSLSSSNGRFIDCSSLTYATSVVVRVVIVRIVRIKEGTQ
jgi:hypothetical protein